VIKRDWSPDRRTSETGQYTGKSPNASAMAGRHHNCLEALDVGS
jgi:hypothetical protein